MDTVKQLVTPPFPDRMTYHEMITNLFDTSFLSEEEIKTLCDAAEMYANGCLKHGLSEKEKDASDWKLKYMQCEQDLTISEKEVDEKEARIKELEDGLKELLKWRYCYDLREEEKEYFENMIKRLQQLLNL